MDILYRFLFQQSGLKGSYTNNPRYYQKIIDRNDIQACLYMDYAERCFCLVVRRYGTYKLTEISF